jgi:ATP-dependent DNA helicase Q4
MRPIDLTRDSDDEGIILDPPKNEDLVVPEPSNTMTSKLSMPKRITSKLKFNILASTLSGLQKTNDLMDTDISIKMLPNKPASSDELPPPPPYQRYSQVVLDTQNKQEQPGSSTTPSLPITCSKKISFASSTSSISKKESHKVNNDNFVRLNMRNSAGSCRGARQKKLRHKYKERMQEQRAAYQKYAPQKVSSKSDHLYASQQTGLDPLDDYVDGVFHFSQKKSTNSNSEVPKCARHQQPCKLLTVRKNTTGNKGRKFYACSMPRGEQCEHFQWADDTVEAARAALADSGVSKFISRQVQQYVERFRTLTVPELKEEATKRSLKKMGKKKELLFRLAVWARDEIAKSCTEEETEDKLNEVEVSIPDDDDDSSCSSNSDEDSTSSEELELFSQEKETVKKMPMNPTCQIITTKDDDIRTGGFHSDDDDEEKDLMLVDSKKPSKPTTLKDTLHELFGHNSFRNGQEWAIERCLSKKRSLLVAPTGFGKSLCYALPAFLGDGICVVISPLISLIHDQLRALPPRISAATLSGSLSAAKTAAILDDILHKRIKVLFVSPERLASPSFQRLFRTTYNPSTQQRERKFPDISLLCIDEAHCVSQWAHNFRPCFLRFQSLLYLMNPQSILAITATAGPRVVSDICQTIGISNQEESIKIIQKGRDNIDVSCQFVASQEERFLMVGIE